MYVVISYVNSGFLCSVITCCMYSFVMTKAGQGSYVLVNKTYHIVAALTSLHFFFAFLRCTALNAAAMSILLYAMRFVM